MVVKLSLEETVKLGETVVDADTEEETEALMLTEGETDGVRLVELVVEGERDVEGEELTEADGLGTLFV